ncbi:beta strand repeat-containing protein [Candidatus Mycoplasma mahonii]|uniref:beta strand repeat-containing protein n=1 Tax=Candidatus Mycoplasma mahonii TaxID=3004105 RepID=UPI0026EE7AB5|nr:hypothetical protein [Candidatus Mycoplasma mahonii]WKX02325.1 hypothetical protein O3I44_02875 [Candidatus Mycoplasma mahonii]
MKKIKIVSSIGIGAIVTTAIAVPLLMMNNGDRVYITPGKKLVDDKIIESREYDTFKETFQDLKLGLTNINVIDMNDDGDNLVLTATGVLPRATVSTHASFIVQSVAAIQDNLNTIKAIFNVVKTTGEVTLLKLLESGSKESEAVIKAAITKNKELNTTAMEQPTARMIDRITSPNSPFLLSSTLIFAIKALGSETALQGLLNPNEIVSNLLDIDIFNELIKVLPEGTIGKNEMLLSDIEITKNDRTGVLEVLVTNANKSFTVSNFLVALSSEDISSRVTAFESYFDSLQVTTFNEGVTADNDKAIYDQIKTDGVYSINTSSNINEMNFLFNAEGDVGSLKDVADAGLVIYNNAIALANTTAKKANDQRHLNAEQLRVNSLSSNGANAKIADAEAQGNFDDNAQTKYGITLGSVTEGAFTYTYDATTTTITIIAVLIDGASDLTIPLATSIDLSPTPAQNTEIETAANLLAAKTTSRNAFTAYFNALTKTSLEGDAVEPSAAKAAYENIKTDGLNSIDNAMSINDLNSLFNAEGDVGSLRDGADAGLVTYNKAIALANKKANDQRHLDAEQLRVNNLVSNGATAKSADAVENGPFNSIAQSKYGITLGSVTEGAFTYTYDATTTTITITAVLNNGAGDLTIPQPESIDLSPTPAENTATAIAATKKANDQRHLNAEQTRINNLVSNGATAKSVDAVDSGAFDNDAQSKYGITLGNATEGAFTYTYDATGTTITITAVLNNGASDLTIPAATPTDLSPTPAQNTTTELLIAAQTESKAAFTNYFDNLSITILVGNSIPFAAQTTYENIKTNGLSSIDNALSIEDVEALFSTTNIGSLKTAADVGLETYNAAIAKANIDNDASLLTAARTASSEAFITYFDTLVTTSLEGDAIEPLAAKTTYENIKTNGLSSIDSATSIDEVNALFDGTTNIGSLKTNADTGLEIYNVAIANANRTASLLTVAKTKAKGFITTIVDGYATVDPANHDASLFGAIANAKTAADDAINDATDIAAVNILATSTTSGSEVAKVLEAINAYEVSTGTIAIALENAKTTAKGFITTIVDGYATADPANHDASLFGAIANAKTEANDAIDDATSIVAVSALATSTTSGSEVAKVLEAINAYEVSTGTIAIALENAKTTAKGFITTIVDGYATADPANHDASLFGAIANAKTEANDAIDDATDIAAVNLLATSTTSGSEVAKVLEAIRLYEASTGTIAIVEALENAKTTAKGFIATIVAKTPQNDNAYNVELFGAIASAQTAANDAIDNATSIAAVSALAASTTGGSEVLKVLEAIDAYETSTGIRADHTKWTTTWERASTGDSAKFITQTGNGYNAEFKDTNGEIYFGDDYTRVHKISNDGQFMSDGSYEWGKKLLGPTHSRDTHIRKIFNWDATHIAVVTQKGTLHILDKETGQSINDVNINVINKFLTTKNNSAFDIENPYWEIKNVSFANSKNGNTKLVLLLQGSTLPLLLNINQSDYSISEETIADNVTIDKISITSSGSYIVAYKVEVNGEQRINIVKQNTLNLATLTNTSNISTKLAEFVNSDEFKNQIQSGGKVHVDEVNFLAKGDIVDLREVNGKIMALNSWGLAFTIGLDGNIENITSIVDSSTWGTLADFFNNYQVHNGDPLFSQYGASYFSWSVNTLDNKLSTLYSIWREYFNGRSGLPMSILGSILFDDANKLYISSQVVGFRSTWAGAWEFLCEIVETDISTLLNGSNPKMINKVMSVALSSEDTKQVDSIRFMDSINGFYVVGGSTGKVALLDSNFEQIAYGIKVYSYDAEIILRESRLFDDGQVVPK